MSPQPPDFNRLLAVGSTHDFSQFREGCIGTVRVRRLTSACRPAA